MSEQDEDFGSLFEASLKAKRFDEGETVRGTIVALRADVAFVDVGGKGEATIEIEELQDHEGDIEVEVGDTIEAVVVSTVGGLKLSRRLARGAASARQLEDAFRSRLPVEGKVEKANKGGFDVRIAGQSAFCPVSQIDVVRGTDAAEHLGRVYTFRIVEFKDGGKNLVVSRRALLEEEQREQAEEIRKGIVAGAILTGRVVSIREYGAFVELGAGIQGLLHVSEMGWSRVQDAAQVVRPGEEITVKVLRVDDEKGKISLGLKQLAADPWMKVPDTYAVGEVRTGRVTRLADFGAFVELEPGVEALAHVSTFPPTGRADGWRAAVTPGTTGAFEILTIEPDKKRIGVALVDEGSSRAAGAEAAEERATSTPGADTQSEGTPGAGMRAAAGAPGLSRVAAPPRVEIVPGARLRGKVERHERFGVFVFLAPGRTGLIPLSETGVAREGDVARAFPVGSDVEVIVLEVEPGGRRIRLSRKAVLDAAEKDEVRSYAERSDGAQAAHFGGSLADKLRDALKPRGK